MFASCIARSVAYCYMLRKIPHLWPTTISLRASLLLSVVVPLAIVSVAAVYIGLEFVERGLEHQMQEDVQLVARAIRLPVSQGVSHHEPTRVKEALESAFKIHRVYGAYVYNMDGDRIAAAGDVTPKHVHPHVLRLVEQRERTGEYDKVEGRRVYSYFVPLSDSGNRIIGLLQVTRRRADFDSRLTDLRLGAALVVLAMLAVIAVVVLTGHRRAIGAPLARLAVVMRRVKGGERARRAAPVGPREIAAVSGALNAMLDSIDAAAHEIAVRRENEQNLARRLLESEKLAILGRFAAGVAHELGGPLSVIDGNARRALRRARGDAQPQAGPELTSIRAEVKRADQVIRQILELAGHGVSRQRVVSCQQLAAAAVGAVNDAARKTHTKLSVNTDCSVCCVNAQPIRMRQALVNILSNAIEATPGGTVKLSWAVERSRVQLWVDDDGPGVPPAWRERLFEPFFTTRQQAGGTGMGLALTQGIVFDHDGHMSVSDSPLGGARVGVTLPLAAPPEMMS